MFELIRPGTKIDFVGKRHVWMGISVACILLTVLLFFTKGLNYGVDFTGGAEVEIKTPQSWDIGKVRTEMEAAGIKGAKVQQVGDPALSHYLIKAQGDQSTLNQISGQIEGVLAKTAKAGNGPDNYEVESVSVVGPAAGSSLRMSGYLSMFYALLCILVYVAIRFDYRFAPGAVLALFHDTVITIGIFIITQKQFDLEILAALLALIGYSNNDTIIVYDRVREETHLHPGMPITEVVNRSVNETLARTLLTSTCTFLTVFALWLLGGKVIEDFAFTLMIGIVVGTYSSIFIASSIVIYITEYQEKRQAKFKATGVGGGRKIKKNVMVRPEPKHI
jgi:preprotein translocase subunit SecF